MMDFAFLFNAELWLWYYQDSFNVGMVCHDISGHGFWISLCEADFPDLDLFFLSFHRDFQFFKFLLEAWISSETQFQ